MVLSAGASGQSTGTVSGKISLAGTDERLPGVTVQISGTTFAAISRSDGSYRIAMRPGRYEMRVRLLGYTGARDSVTISAGQDQTRDYSLSRSVTQLAAAAVTGTRAEERTVVTSPVPIDVLNAGELRTTGRSETAQVIQMLAPSFNFPRPSVSDGTDHVRPATLRGLGADQTLVLINGKRRYPSALVNNNGTIGRGTSAVDLNAIPASMIERIEVLRDGAAAQYGSDAIAGVINVILKGAEAGDAALQLGQSSKGDGDNLTVNASKGFTFGAGDYVHVGVEVRDRGMTNRSAEDRRQQYFTGDPREATANRLNHWQGDAETTDATLMFNAARNFSTGVQLYSFGALGHRKGLSTGFFRRPFDDRTIRSIHPDGFLPQIESRIWDGSFAAGLRGNTKGWRWDLSQVYGANNFNFIVSNSNNASMGASSPTTFDAGKLGFAQAMTNFDGFREVRLGSRTLRVGTGAEFRYENYTIDAGELASYTDGKRPLLDRNGVARVNAQGQPNPPAAVGSQVFPGFTPADATNEGRTAGALYLDLETDLSNKFMIGAAGRFENFSDFGSTTTGKITARFAPTSRFSVRGAVATGFRAPSLQQSHFTSTATIFVAGVAREIKTFPVASREAQLLGASPLTPETSVNVSGGFTVEPARNFTLTVDAYRVTISDRVVLSENFVGTAIVNWFAQNGFPSVTGGRYFTNAINTSTDGLDVVANYGIDLKSNGLLRLTAGYNQNKTKVTEVVVNTPAALGNLSETLFGRAERGRIEVGQPKNNLLLTSMWDRKGLSAMLRAQRYGEVTSIQALATGTARQVPDQTYGAKVIADASVSYKFTRRFTLSVGVDNLLDVYPDENKDRGDVATGYGGNSNFGIFRYSGLSPFGFNGRFVYSRIAISY